jgi:hypothetical protein
LKLAEKNEFEYEFTELYLLEVDRLKSLGTMSDMEILIKASENVLGVWSKILGRI